MMYFHGHIHDRLFKSSNISDTLHNKDPFLPCSYSSGSCFLFFFLISIFIYVVFMWQLFVKATQCTNVVCNVVFDSTVLLGRSYGKDEGTKRYMKP
jgi:hypothetical protein